MTLVPRRPLVAVLLVLAAGTTAGCSSDGPAPTPATEASAEAATVDDVEAVLAAVDSTEAEGTGAYVSRQIVEGSRDLPDGPVVSRYGEYDVVGRIHESRIVLDAAASLGADSDLKPGTRDSPNLIFLVTDDDVLMDNPSFTARTGKRWTRLGTDALGEALGSVVSDIPLVAVPAADLLRTAHLPGSRRAPGPGEAQRVRVSVDELDAVGLLSGRALADLNKARSPEELAAEFAGSLDADVGIDAAGRWISLSVDLTELARHIARVGPSPEQAENTGTLRYELVLESLGRPTLLTFPPESEIADP